MALWHYLLSCGVESNCTCGALCALCSYLGISLGINKVSIHLSIYLSSLKAEVVTPDHTCSKTADTGEGTTLYREERVYSMYIQ